MRRYRTCECCGAPANLRDCQKDQDDSASDVGPGDEDWTRCLSCPN